MKVTAIEIKCIRGFRELPKTEVSKTINVLIGPNNVGKSTILKTISLLQNNNFLDQNIGRIGGLTHPSARIYFDGDHSPNFEIQSLGGLKPIGVEIIGPTTSRYLLNESDYPTGNSLPSMSEIEPNILIYGFDSKRKVNSLTTEINETRQITNSSTLENLNPKLDRITNPEDRNYNEFINYCEQILGFRVSTFVVGNGKRSGYNVRASNSKIGLEQMGEGVGNILGLIERLCGVENKIFLIEELENDIHPKALKGLLQLIIEKSKTNQFFISTHSHIVMQYLGADPGTKVFEVTNNQSSISQGELAESFMKPVDTEEDRLRVLEDLGYELGDMSLFEGWLFLEESSAERIIREYFIPWFIPGLSGKIKTYGSQGREDVEPKFSNFNKLFTFIHLSEEIYKNKAFVLIDGGKEEDKLIEYMRETYCQHGWDKDNFLQFSEHDFEKYYPDYFKEEAERVIAISDSQIKRREKKLLLEKVVKWIKEDMERAKEEFSKSATEVIGILQTIEKKLLGK